MSKSDGWVGQVGGWVRKGSKSKTVDLFHTLPEAKRNQTETNSDPDLDVSSHSPCTTPWDWRKLMAGYRGGRSSEVQDGRQLITWVGEQLKKKGRLYLLKYQVQTF